MRGATIVVKCERCRGEFSARVADRKRGWGRFCSKSCKAVRQTQVTGRGKPHDWSKPDRDGHTGDWAMYLASVHPFDMEG